jgi:tetratricopeptide (TPR) repeat protein
MSDRQRALLGAALLVLAAIGTWLWARKAPTPTPQAVVAQQQSDLHARALLKVVASRADLPPDDPEVQWLEDELRYLLTRAQVALARPQGPFEAADGAAVFTLRAAVSGRPGEPAELSLLTPDGQIERTATVDPGGQSRLALASALARRLPSFMPRGDTGVAPAQFLGTSDGEAYDTLAAAQIAAASTGTLLQARINSRDTPIDGLEALTRSHPDFARAWASLALLYLDVEGQDAPSLTGKAEKAARRALALDGKLAPAHAALGIAEQRQGKWLTADASLAQALSLDPALRPALDAFGCLLIDAGRTRYATLIAEQGVAAGNPQRSPSCLDYARMAADQAPGDHPDASDPGAGLPLALTALLEGRRDASRAVLASGMGSPAQVDTWFQPVVRALEEPSLRPVALREITRAASDSTLDPATEIMLGIALQQPDFVFNRLLRLHAQGKAVPTRFLWIRPAEFLREHARFATVTEQLGLKSYWQERGLPDVCNNAADLAICR